MNRKPDRPDETATEAAIEIMAAFAERTGLEPEGAAPRRYLWTDAFAVCNFLALARRTGDPSHRRSALRLVEQVHRTLGRHRPDDPRDGWISGLPDEEGERHPTRGGLRIGKPLPERAPGERFDERLEWERDGQYFHYLTKWMHALARVAGGADTSEALRWAIELAEAAHDAFAYTAPDGKRRMSWKMSVDLSRPLVPSMGQHDPLDGWLTFLDLRAAAARTPGAGDLPDLGPRLGDLRRIAEATEWASADPLGLGGLLTDALRLGRRVVRGEADEERLLVRLLDASLRSLGAFAGRDPLRGPAAARLAFRELGLAIGFAAVRRLARLLDEEPGRLAGREGVARRVEELARHAALGERIEAFWLEPAHRRVASWTDHLDIDEVMLATCLVPEGFLEG